MAGKEIKLRLAKIVSDDRVIAARRSLIDLNAAMQKDSKKKVVRRRTRRLLTATEVLVNRAETGTEKTKNLLLESIRFV
ncbi:MAG: hypothetical protein M1484_03430 [Patescibacteria group bacterium]|nr:hypothetical protein [Patescibacteria group bacterium]